MLTINLKKTHLDAKLPQYQKKGDAGMDLVAVSRTITDDYISYDTGIAIEIPEGYVGLLFPRSSISNTDLMLCNSVGVIDSGYRGNITFRFDTPTYHKLLEEHPKHLVVGLREEVEMSDMGETIINDICTEYKIYDIGERIGQILIVPYPQVEFKVVDELSTTDRGTGGYGSTNVKN